MSECLVPSGNKLASPSFLRAACMAECHWLKPNIEKRCVAEKLRLTMWVNRNMRTPRHVYYKRMKFHEDFVGVIVLLIIKLSEFNLKKILYVNHYVAASKVLTSTDSHICV